MKALPRPRLLALGAVLIFALALGLAYSGTDGAREDTDDPESSPLPGLTSGPLFDYLASLLEIIDDADSGTSDAIGRFNETSLQSAEDAVIVSTMQAYLSDIETVFTDASGRLEALNAPDVAITHHRTYIEGVRGSIDAGNSLRLDLPSLDTRSKLDVRLAQFEAEVSAAAEISRGACFALQKMADTDFLAIDLGC